jgi:hypothetical protein
MDLANCNAEHRLLALRLRNASDSESDSPENKVAFPSPIGVNQVPWTANEFGFSHGDCGKFGCVFVNSVAGDMRGNENRLMLPAN